jgi:glycerophosphoryl diester phosphodiesterase
MSRSSHSLITAHRGASGLAPENTLSAIRKAMEIGSDYAEIDIHLSQDCDFVLLHDDTLDRTTNGNGYVWNYPVAVLKKLDAGSWFSPFYKNETMPTLSEVIQLVQGRMKLNIEIKITPFKHDSAEKLIQLIQAFHFANQCIITSFDQKTIEQIHACAPYLTTGLILNQRPSDSIFKNTWKLFSINYKFVNSHLVQRAVAVQKEIHVWTVNEINEMERCISLDVHSIITNYPNRLKNVLLQFMTC